MQQSSHETIPPSTNELRYWLALLRTAKIGPIHFSKLLSFFPKLEELFTLSSATLNSLGLAPESVQEIQQPNWQAVDQDLAWAEEKHHHILTLHHPLYPFQLKQIANAPPVLFIKGKADILNQPQLAIVGSRNPTPTGIDNARQFSQQLVAAGFTITSGLALGIDTAAHHGALETSGQTIAVLGGSLDRIYPSSNTKLAEKIAAEGSLISEFPFGTKPRAEHFPQRNRIVSGLSLGVLVVEATIRSGSLITARLAGEQGRELFAIPGSIHNPLARGCHFLIRQGAKLIETTADILEELPPLPQAHKPQPPSRPKVFKKNSLDADHQLLLQCIDYETASIDRIQDRSGLPIHAVTAMLTQLELDGEVYRTHNGGYMKSTRDST